MNKRIAMDKRTVTITATYVVRETFDVPADVADVEEWSLGLVDEMSLEDKEWEGTFAVDEKDEELWSC